MNTNISRRILSLFLALTLTVGLCPVGAAADDAETQETLAAAETTAETTEAETVAPETTVPETQAETTAPATQPSETEEPTVPETTEAAQETEATQAETEPETEPATEPTEETLPAVELPYGFAGLPEDAPLSAQALADKQAMAEHQVAENTATLTPGENYEEGVVLVSAESQEEAQRYADAFSAELVYYLDGFAKLRLTTATVAQAVEAAQDMTLPLPAAYPNHRTVMEPKTEEEQPTGTGASLFGEDTPQRQSWKTWMENLDHPDEFLKDPTDYHYQYQHDVLDSYAAWGVSTGKGVTVAVLDTGVNGSHQDLAGKVSYAALTEYGISTNDIEGHGTHVAGIIAATMNNGAGGAGVAPDAKILSIRVMDDDGYMDDDYIISGIYLAANRGATVINMSLGGVGYNQCFQRAVNTVTARGVTVIAAMGNDSSNCMNYPAAYDNVIAVAATDRTNTLAHYSSYGPWADVAAPGSWIWSTYHESNTMYASMPGTSMACPMVAGVVALYKSVYSNATPAQIEARLKSTATKGGKDLGAGIVNAANMLSTKPATPEFKITSNGSDVATSAGNPISVPRESQLEFTFTAYKDNNEFIVYTLDGSNPSVKNGSVVKGSVYDGPIDLSPYAGQTITVKAMQVNGLGMAGGVLSRKIQVKPATVVVDRIEITGPSELLAGKTGEFQVKITPTEDWMVADQSVTWRISNRSSNMAKAKIDSRSGKLTTPALKAGESGWVVIAAVSKTYAGKSAVFQVTVKALDPVKTMTLSQAKVAIFTGNTHSLDVTMYSVTGAQVTPNVRWTSSNTKVAIVDENGLVTAVGRGGATITCKALDGSGKSAKCTVSVLQKVESITITGQTSVAPGASATFKAAVFPSTAPKNVTWSVESGPATISSSGKLTVPAYASIGSIITIVAQPPEGGGESGRYQVEVQPKANAVRVALAYQWEDSALDNEPLDWSYKGSTGYNNSLYSITLYSVDPASDFGYEGRQDQVRLAADTFDRNWDCLNNPGCVQLTSSNPAIATVEWSPDGWWLTAHAAGTARITAAAQDGSGKKASFSVKVLNPVSTFSLDTSAPNGNMGWYLLAAGKSVSHKPVFATTYGKPSNQKVTWSYQVEGSNGYSYTYAMRDYIKLDKSGKLTISANAASYIQNLAQSNILLYVDVTASSQDYVWAEDTFRYQLVVPTTTMRATYSKITCVDGPGYFYGAEFYCNQWSETDSKSDFYGMSDFAVTSSNPSVISVDGVYRTSYKNWHNVVFYAAKRGSATLTIRATDGTNKSCTIKVTIP